jgi:hypothetical protein
LIIDSRGRRCWGDLSVAGNNLCITIPEAWLSEAEYPVVVDPTIGTTTVGSQNKWYDPDNEATASLMFELSIPVNRFLASETINGACTAYVYTNEDDYEAGGRPVLYADNGNKPHIRKSAQEGFLDLRVTGSKPKGWRSATFSSNGSIASGSYVWFGVFVECYWLPRFDYGARCYTDWWWDYGVETTVPDEYPLSSADYYRDFKLPMYFTYTSAQTYTRTLTQGVTLADTRKLTGAYKRSAIQTVQGTTVLKRVESFYRSIIQSVKNTAALKGSPMRIVRLIEAAAALYEMKTETEFKRGTADTAGIGSITGGAVLFFRTLFGLAEGGDHTGGLVTRMRLIQDTETVGDETGHTADYLRGLFVEAGNIAETTHRGEYYRVQQDTAGSEAVPLRHLFIFLRLLTAAYIRDYIIGRFLKSKEELVIKSPVYREIILDSTLH